MFQNKSLFSVPRPRRVLVLSPHPDDEAVGCGGYLAALAGQGAEITVLYVSDGGLGPAGHDESLVALRCVEAEAASKVLGIRRLVRWNLRDGQLDSMQMPIASLETLLKELDVEAVLTPHPGESHSDHSAVAKLLGQVQPGQFNDLLVMTYEIWTPLSPNCVVNISARMDDKLRAIRAYESQRERYKLEMLATGLGQYRAAWSRMRSWQYAECFRRLSLSQYREECRAD